VESLSAPLDVFIAVTSRCNLACRHCNVFSLRNSRTDLIGDEWIKFIKRLAELKVFTLWISGGEPFMREDIFAIFEEIEKHHFRFGLNTNGMLVDEEKSKRISELEKLYSIFVSLDGSTAEIHEKLRGKGSFEGVIDGIKNLLKYNGNVSTYTTVTRDNYKDIENIIRLGKSLGLESVKFNEILPLGNAALHLNKLTLSNHQRREVTKDVKRLRDRYGDFVTGMILEMGDFFEGFENLEREYATDCPDAANGLFGCGGGIEKCTVRSDGWVVPCDRLWDFKAGNIRETDFKEIWQSSRVFHDMRMRSSVSLNDIEECNGCMYKSFCVGGCPAVSYYLSGSVLKPDPMSCYRIFRDKGFPYNRSRPINMEKKDDYNQIQVSL